MSHLLLTSKEHLTRPATLDNSGLGAVERQSRAVFLSPPRTRSTPERPAKRPKTYHREERPARPARPARNQPEGDEVRTAGFWDNLTRIPLAKSALKELERRNKHHHLPRPVQPASFSAFAGDILRYARHGGPDLSDLRGFEDMAPTPAGGGQQKRPNRGGIKKARGRGGSKSSSRTPSKRTKSSSPYDAAFRQHLVDNKVWPIGHWLCGGTRPPAPDNLQEILGKLHESGRDSLQPHSFTRDDFTELQKAYDIAAHEEARSRTLDAIEGALGRHTAYSKQGPVRATNLAPLTPQNLAPGNPDRVYGARPEVLQQAVRHALDQLILPTAAKSLLCPNFIVHIKGPNGSPEVAKLQAVYDGALAARGMEALWAFGEGGEDGDEEDPGSHIARTITCTFVEGILRMYAVHLYHGQGPVQLLQQSVPLRLEDVEYSTTLLGTWPIYDDFEGFCKGAAAFRNGLEWARKQVDRAILRANARPGVASPAYSAGDNVLD